MVTSYWSLAYSSESSCAFRSFDLLALSKDFLRFPSASFGLLLEISDRPLLGLKRCSAANAALLWSISGWKLRPCKWFLIYSTWRRYFSNVSRIWPECSLLSSLEASVIIIWSPGLVTRKFSPGSTTCKSPAVRSSTFWEKETWFPTLLSTCVEGYSKGTKGIWLS